MSKLWMGGMSLQFIGEAGIYLADRDAIKIDAIAGTALSIAMSRNRLCFQSASRNPENFEARRIDCEIAALVKFRRATTKLVSLEITAADLAAIEGSHAA
jgi:hypothetical protein